MSFIDRNPEKMVAYAKEARNIIGDMTLTIRKIEGILDSFSPDLDSPTQKKIQELHNCCNEYIKEMETYQKVAHSIFIKGKKLGDIRNGGY